MSDIITANTENKQDIVDFINYVFSVAYTSHDFKKKLPKVYGDTAKEDAASHYIIKKDNRIKAALSYRKISVDVCGTTLKYGLIGNVSVHPYCRGEGYMTELMNHVIEIAKSDGTDLMVLTGQRQRYGYFGFEPAGTKLRYTLTDTNIKHFLKDIDCSDISFLSIENASNTEIDKIIRLYEMRPAHTLRDSDEYINIMSSWEEKTNLIFNYGQLVGYIYGALSEIVLEDEELLYPVIKTYFNISGTKTADISVQPFEMRRAELLHAICETSCIMPVSLIKVMNWENVLTAFLKLKAVTHLLPDSQITVKIENEVLKLTLSSGIVTVEKAEMETPDFCFCEKDALSLFFGLNGLVIQESETASLSALPFVIDRPDTF